MKIIAGLNSIARNFSSEYGLPIYNSKALTEMTDTVVFLLKEEDNLAGKKKPKKKGSKKGC